MAKRNPKGRSSSRKSAGASFEMTRIKLLYGLSGVLTLCVACLLIARPAPLSPALVGVLAAVKKDPVDSAIQTDREIDPDLWKRIVVKRSDSLASTSFHFAILPQASGDQIAIAPEWGLQQDFDVRPGELRVVLVSADPSLEPAREKTIRLLVERLRDRLRITDADVVWQ